MSANHRNAALGHRFVALVLMSGIGHACSGEIQLAPRGPHPPTYAATPIVVTSEPPPAEIENVSPSPGDNCYWADGYWRWVDEGWTWSPGKWVVNPEDCYYADSLMTWVPTPGAPGALYYTQGRWYHRKSGEFCPEPAACKSP